MGGVPMKHHTRSKVGRRRSHLALKSISINVCPECSNPVLPHKMCPNCGSYKGRTVLKTKLKVKKD